jgi:flagellar basal-body rod modification protein FlgD
MAACSERAAVSISGFKEITMAIASATNTTPTPTSGGASAPAKDGATLADNFQSFLTLLTTQLQHQNPTDPLDTNQFTQQLVQFAQVEQQLKSNDHLTKLLDVEKANQSTQALAFVGSTVIVDGSSARLGAEAGAGISATWNVIAPKNTQATFTITNSAGQEVYKSNINVDENLEFVWDGKSKDGTAWPVGDYKLTVTGKDSSGKDVVVSTEVKAKVDSVDLTSNPPLLSIGGKNYTVDKIKRVESATPAPTSTPSP